jgi:hypothetical protein
LTPAGDGLAVVFPAQRCDTSKHYNFSGNYKSRKTQGKPRAGRLRKPFAFLFAFQLAGINV